MINNFDINDDIIMSYIEENVGVFDWYQKMKMIKHMFGKPHNNDKEVGEEAIKFINENFI